MLLIYERMPSHVPLKIVNIEDGKVLKSFNHLLRRTRKVDFIEQFNEKLLVKQEAENLQILDVRAKDSRVLESRVFGFYSFRFLGFYAFRSFRIFGFYKTKVLGFRVSGFKGLQVIKT